MDKTIIIDGRPVTFRKTAGTERRYQMQFGREFMDDLNKILVVRAAISKEDTAEDFKIKTVLGMETSWMYDIAFTMAQQADPTIRDELTWLDSFEEMNIFDIISELIPMIVKESRRSVKNA